MRTGLALSLAAVVAGNAQAAVDVAVPLAPSGKWVVEYEKNECALSRKFGGGPGGEVSLGIRPATLAETVTVALIAEGSLAELPKQPGRRLIRIRPAAILLAPSGESITILGDLNGAIAGARRGALLTINRSDLPAVFAATRLSIEAGGMAVSIAPTGSQAALRALQSCETQLMIRWGIDPASVAAVTTPPRGGPDIAEWITYRDYPQDALRRRSQGVTTILWQIGLNGAVSGCRAVKSAGDPVLDAAACRAITKRARYSPALDKDGHAVTSWVTRKVTWSMPGS